MPNNRIKVHTSCEIIQNNDATVEDINYSHTALDGNADSRTWGGTYTVRSAETDSYTDDDVCFWNGVVVADTAASDGLGDDTWTKGSVLKTGKFPTTAHVVAIEYVSELGTANVTVNIGGIIHALLKVGESVVIPLHTGDAVADVDIYSAEYVVDTHEATVNVMVAGV